jgi:hypothetical protein
MGERSRLAVVTIALFFGLGSAYGQTPERRFDKIEVILDGSSCMDAPKQIAVIIHDGDTVELTAIRVGDENRWIIKKTPRKFPDNVLASVRWKQKRTPCTAASANDANYRDGLLAFRFSQCTSSGAVDLAIDTNLDSVFSTYIRTLTMGKVRCREVGSFSGHGDVSNVQTRVEEVRLQFGEQPSPNDPLGLRVNDVLNKRPKKKPVFVTRDKAAHLLSVQRLEGDHASPTNSSTAIEIDALKLKIDNLKSFTMAW